MSKQTKLRFSLVAVGAFGLLSGTFSNALAASDTDNINLSATVNSEVSINLTDASLAFGSLNPLTGSGTAVDTAAGSIASNTTVTLSMPDHVDMTNGTGGTLPVGIGATVDNGGTFLSEPLMSNGAGALSLADITMNSGTQSALFDVTGTLTYNNTTPPGNYTGSLTVTATTP